MQKGLYNISDTTYKVWYKYEKAIEDKHGEYRYRIGINGLGEVILEDFRTCTTIAKGNGAVQKAIRRLGGAKE